MKQHELKEILGLLGEAGVNPQLCNYKVHVSSCPALCGPPSMPGDDDGSDGLLLPEQLVGCQPEIFIPARGDSMVDAGVDEGDLLRVRLGVSARDGDIVVAMVNGSATVKALFGDDQGRHWLVPCNERYDAIQLAATDSVRIVGTVVGVEKRVLRATSADCLRIIRRTLAHRQEPSPLSGEQVEGVIVAVAPEVANGRQWYAVYRAMADRQVVVEGHYREFAELVARAVPGHAHLPVGKELGRMAVLSFRRRVALWDAADAPVCARRFADYQRLARLTSSLLSR